MRLGSKGNYYGAPKYGLVLSSGLILDHMFWAKKDPSMLGDPNELFWGKKPWLKNSGPESVPKRK